MGSYSLLRRRAGDALVVALAVASLIEVWVSVVPSPRWALTIVALLGALPLLFRRRLPLLAPLIVYVDFAVASFFVADGLETLALPVLMALSAAWVIGRENERSRAVVGLVIAYACIQILTAQFAGNIGAGDVFFTGLVALAPWTAGHVVRRRAAQAAELRDLATRLEQEREQRARAAVADERLRIARELHDVVAHSISVMTIQAGAARLLLDNEADRAEEPLLRVEETGRQTLAEMRRLLGVLQSDPGDASLEARPSLAHVTALVERFRRAGLPIELEISGTPRPLAAGLDLAAYRIVQEALTNTLRHAGAARARVAVSYEPGLLDVEVTDDGHAHGATKQGGHGLVGMRERVAIYGGELAVGPGATGGFSVHARFPFEAATA